jgi:putative heme iron utilization protein
MPHEPRLTRELRNLLNTQRVASLGTIDETGAPIVSMVPFAIEPQLHCLVIHVSGLAAHTRYLQARDVVSLMVMQAEVAGQPVHALPRVTLEGVAKVAERGCSEWTACRTAYLTRFPEAEPMTELGDFMFVSICVTGARHVAGFGVARSLDADEIRLVLGPSEQSMGHKA